VLLSETVTPSFERAWLKTQQTNGKKHKSILSVGADVDRC